MVREQVQEEQETIFQEGRTIWATRWHRFITNRSRSEEGGAGGFSEVEA